VGRNEWRDREGEMIVMRQVLVIATVALLSACGSRSGTLVADIDTRSAPSDIAPEQTDSVWDVATIDLGKKSDVADTLADTPEAKEETADSDTELEAVEVLVDTPCVPDCSGKECGDDGCGGSCGACGPGKPCAMGHCPSEGTECYDANDDPWDGCHEGKIGEFRVDDSTAEPCYFGMPSVATADDGSYSVAWTAGTCGNELDDGTFLRRFPEDGGQAEDIILLDETPSMMPQLIAMKGGDLLVVQSHEDRVDAHLTLPEVPPLVLSVGLAGVHKFPSVAAVSDNEVLVVWFHYPDPTDLLNGKLVGRLLDTDLGQTSELLVLGNVEYMDESYLRRVTAVAAGTEMNLVGWNSKVNSDVPDSCNAMDLLLLPWQIGDEKELPESVSHFISHIHVSPSICSVGDGSFVVAWEDRHGEPDEWWCVPREESEEYFGVLLRRLDAGGEIVGSILDLDEASGAGGFPAVGCAGDGSVQAVWLNGSMLVKTGRLVGDKVVPGPDANTLEGRDVWWPAIGVFADGSYIVAWTSVDSTVAGISAQRFTADGTRLYR
jgi:hypothetical protein